MILGGVDAGADAREDACTMDGFGGADPTGSRSEERADERPFLIVPVAVGTALALVPLPVVARASLALGAAVVLGALSAGPDRAFRTGALLAVPGAVAAIAEAGGSPTAVALVVVATPVSAVVNAFAVRFGTSMQGDSGRAKRGRILVAVWAGVIAASAGWHRIGNEVMDNRAASVARAIEAGLDDRDPDSVLSPFGETAGRARFELAGRVDGATLAGGPYGQLRFDVVSWWAPWSSRCVLARPAADGAWEVRTADEACDDVSW